MASFLLSLFALAAASTGAASSNPVMASRRGSSIPYRETLVEFGALPYGPTPLLLDSKSAIDLTFDAVAFKKTKHILRDAYFLRDVVARLVFAPRHVSSEDQWADILTKPLACMIFARLRARLLHVPARTRPRPRAGGADTTAA